MNSDTSKPQICFLLALWGKNYIRMFCEVSLRSLLAGGNIPALANEYKCSFTLLTKPEDIAFFEAQPLIPPLKKYCDLRYVDIRDVIFPLNHSATLTVALERGMRSFGPQMLNTYFIFLVADYLFASQAFAGLLPYLRRGVSAVSAGNYQVVEEEVQESIQSFIDPKTGILEVPNRDLVAWSFRHLHPMTIANTVTQDETHIQHPNRLFWRVDADTMIGRYYLRHMLCVKPEIENYVIGSSCDYSFIAEMCPSGNVARLSDSDEYFVIELQPQLHEANQMALGSLTPRMLAASLVEWATAEQRANAHFPVVFHAKDVPASAAGVVEASGRYIAEAEQLLEVPPAPVRGHYYWNSCIQWITADHADEPAKATQQMEEIRRNLWDSKTFGPPFAALGIHIDSFPPMQMDRLDGNAQTMLQLFTLYTQAFGRLPDIHPWHPHYFDYQLLSRSLAGTPGKTLLVLQPKRRNLLEWADDSRFMMRSLLILYRNRAELREELKDIANCVINLPLECDALTGAIFDVLADTMPPGSTIHIFARTQYNRGKAHYAGRRAMHYLHLGQRGSAALVGGHFYAGRVRRHLDRWLSSASTRLTIKFHRPLIAFWCFIQIGVLHILYALHNLIALCLPATVTPKSKDACSALVTFRTGT